MDAPALAQAKALDSKSSTVSKSLESLLPVNKTVSAKVTQVSPDSSQPNTHKVKLEVNNRQIQVSVKFEGKPPEQGSTVTLARSASGQIELKVAVDPNGAKSSAAQTADSKPPTAASNTQNSAQTKLESSTKTLLNNITTPAANNSASSSTNNVILKAPVTINASGQALAAIEKSLPRGETINAKVINQNPNQASVNTESKNLLSQLSNNNTAHAARIINQVLPNTANSQPLPSAPTTTLANSAPTNLNSSQPQGVVSNLTATSVTTANTQLVNTANTIINNTLAQTNAPAATPLPTPSTPGTAVPSYSAPNPTGPTSPAPSPNQSPVSNTPAQASAATNTAPPSQPTVSNTTGDTYSIRPAVSVQPSSTTNPSPAALSQTLNTSSAANSVPAIPTPAANANPTTTAQATPVAQTGPSSSASALSTGVSAASSAPVTPAAPLTTAATANPAPPTTPNTPAAITTASTPVANNPTANPANSPVVNLAQNIRSQPPTNLATAPAISSANAVAPTASSPTPIVNNQPAPAANVTNNTQAATNTGAANTGHSTVQTATNTAGLPNSITATPAVTTQALAPTGAATSAIGTSSPQSSTQTTPSTLAAPTSTVTSQSTTQPSQAPSLQQSSSASPASQTAVSGATPTQAAAPQNAQLNVLPSQSTTIKIAVAGREVSLQAPANLPPLNNVQITRTQGPQANIQWQQPSQVSSPVLNSLPSLSPKQAALVETSLRQALPQQIPIAEGINQLVAQSAQLASSPSAISASVDKVAFSIMQMFGVKPGARNSSETIKRNVQQGGLFTESKMLSQTGGQQGDMKSFLAKLSLLADQLPPEQRDKLQNTADRMLARVTTNQLTHVQQQHVKADASNERSFQLDIPVQHNEKLDNVEIEIKQRKHQNEEGELVSIWSVKMHFDLEDKGEVDAEVALNPVDNSISTTFLCTNFSTVQEIEQRMTGFRGQLHHQGFDVQTLHCSQGSQAASANNPISKRIIDIRT